MNFAVDDTPFLMFTMLASDSVAAFHSCCKTQVITPAADIITSAADAATYFCCRNCYCLLLLLTCAADAFTYNHILIY